MPRLRRSDPPTAGLHRTRAGRGFFYTDTGGHSITDQELRARIEQLAIPPTWTDVWIAPHANGHIQATGVDAAGRRQDLYHPSWREQKDRVKFDRALRLAESLPAARRRVTMDLRLPEPTRERALATAFRMLDTGSFRAGSEQYAEANGSHGLATLRCSHATVSGDTVSLNCPAKSGQEEVAVRNHGCRRRCRGSSSEAARSERAGGEFTAKDSRTHHDTVAAATSLATYGAGQRKAARDRAVTGDAGRRPGSRQNPVHRQEK